MNSRANLILAKKLLLIAEELVQESGHLAEDMDEVLPTPKKSPQEQEMEDIGRTKMLTKEDKKLPIS